MRTSYPPLTAFSTLPSTGRRDWNASSSCRAVAARRASRLNAVTGNNFEGAVLILQFVDLDHGFAFAADVDKRHLWADLDNGALDRLTLLKPLCLMRCLEHRGEIFLGLTHNMLQSYFRAHETARTR